VQQREWGRAYMVCIHWIHRQPSDISM
jgi:hypothetical protein